MTEVLEIKSNENIPENNSLGFKSKEQILLEAEKRLRDLVTGQFQSKYNPDIAAAMIAYMASGFTLSACCGEFLISKSTVYNWMEDNPLFKEAVDVALLARQNYLEKKFLDTKLPAEVTKMIFALKVSKTSTDWVETTNNRVELSGPNGMPIQTQQQVEQITYTVVDPLKPVENNPIPEIEGVLVEE